jgi:hypothetical protein
LFPAGFGLKSLKKSPRHAEGVFFFFLTPYQTILFQIPVALRNSSIWSAVQSKFARKDSWLKKSILFTASAWQDPIRWIGVSGVSRQSLHLGSIRGLDLFAWYLRPQWPEINWTSIPTSCLSVLLLSTLLSFVTFCDTFWINCLECLQKSGFATHFCCHWSLSLASKLLWKWEAGAWGHGPVLD